MKASVCSKEYASTFCDPFFYLIVLKGCYLNIKSNYAQTPFSVAGFSMNPETENYFVASTEFFFFGKYSQEKLFVHSTGKLSAHKLQHTCRLHYL